MHDHVDDFITLCFQRRPIAQLLFAGRFIDYKRVPIVTEADKISLDRRLL